MYVTCNWLLRNFCSISSIPIQYGTVTTYNYPTIKKTGNTKQYNECCHLLSAYNSVRTTRQTTDRDEPLTMNTISQKLLLTTSIKTLRPLKSKYQALPNTTCAKNIKCTLYSLEQSAFWLGWYRIRGNYYLTDNWTIIPLDTNSCCEAMLLSSWALYIRWSLSYRSQMTIKSTLISL